MRNIEIKAKIKHPDDVITYLRGMNITEGSIINQHDTFFKVVGGRLKLREFADGSGELIFYKRSDQTGPKLCNYEKVTLEPNSCEGVRNVLTASNGCLGIVKKVRKLYMVGNTRVHVDDVDGLGHYMELEVVLSDDESTEKGEEIAHDLMGKLGVKTDNLIAGAYIDLLLTQDKPMPIDV